MGPYMELSDMLNMLLVKELEEKGCIVTYPKLALSLRIFPLYIALRVCPQLLGSLLIFCTRPELLDLLTDPVLSSGKRQEWLVAAAAAAIGYCRILLLVVVIVFQPSH